MPTRTHRRTHLWMTAPPAPDVRCVMVIATAVCECPVQRCTTVRFRMASWPPPCAVIAPNAHARPWETRRMAIHSPSSAYPANARKGRIHPCFGTSPAGRYMLPVVGYIHRYLRMASISHYTSSPIPRPTELRDEAHHLRQHTGAASCIQRRIALVAGLALLAVVAVRVISTVLAHACRFVAGGAMPMALARYADTLGSKPARRTTSAIRRTAAVAAVASGIACCAVVARDCHQRAAHDAPDVRRSNRPKGCASPSAAARTHRDMCRSR